MTRAATRRAAYAALVVVYVLHNDLWLWDDPGMVLGLPVGLTYHVAYSLLAAVTMALLVRFAWPDELEVEADASPAGGHGIPSAEELVSGPGDSGDSRRADPSGTDDTGVGAGGPGNGADPDGPDGGPGAEPEARDDGEAGR